MVSSRICQYTQNTGSGTAAPTHLLALYTISSTGTLDPRGGGLLMQKLYNPAWKNATVFVKSNTHPVLNLCQGYQGAGRVPFRHKGAGSKDQNNQGAGSTNECC